MGAHAKHFRPSAAERWMNCPGSVALCAEIPESESSEYAAEGTAAHLLAAELLETGGTAEDHIGRVIKVAPYSFAVDEAFAGHVQTYVDRVREYADEGDLLVEQRVKFGPAIGAGDDEGTSDAVILAPPELQVHDLKFGMGVKVYAERNPQLMLYALGALREYDILGEFERVRMVIHQPRLGHLSEWDCTAKELQAFADQAGAKVAAAERCLLEGFAKDDDLNPGEAQCRWCPVKATCPALAVVVAETTACDFADLTAPAEPPQEPDDLAGKMTLVDLIEGWCKAIRSEVEARLLKGVSVPGFKLVEGRRGARKWVSDDEAEEALKGMRLKTAQMYDLKLISPTTAEKLKKSAAIGPRQWKRLEALVERRDGKPSVALESDPRPAISLAADGEFDSLT